jgi:hypothetical protein
MMRYDFDQKMCFELRSRWYQVIFGTFMVEPDILLNSLLDCVEKFSQKTTSESNHVKSNAYTLKKKVYYETCIQVKNLWGFVPVYRT